MQLLFANCFADTTGHDVLATGERIVAEAVPSDVRTVMSDSLIDPDQGQAANVAMWRLAFDWFDRFGDDPTLCAGVSAGDLAGVEVGTSILVPAARGALGGQALLDKLAPRSVSAGIPANGGTSYRRAESVECAALEAVARALLGDDAVTDPVVSSDARNEILVAKYARVRDPEWLSDVTRLRRLKELARGVTATGYRMRGKRSTLLVYEYNPTRDFAERYATSPNRKYRLVRIGAPARALIRSLAAGDVIEHAPSVRLDGRDPNTHDRLHAWQAHHAAELCDATMIAGIPIWDVVGEQVLEAVEKYSAYIRAAAPRIHDLLERFRVERVLVPFDVPPEARLFVRVAQQAGVQTFVLNNGILADEFQHECMTADVGLAWTDALADGYFRRRTRGFTVVTGNPKADTRPTLAKRDHHDPAAPHVLVGTFTYSPVDVNCRRADAERYLDDVLGGVEFAFEAAARTTVKLHPADTVAHYERLKRGATRGSVTVVSNGDISSLFPDVSVYVSTYSTSLLEAAAHGLPVIYYRVNPQRLLAPFAGDPFLEEWTAEDIAGLAELLRRATTDPPPSSSLAEWASRYLGALDGRSVERMTAALEATRPAA